jgi:hypothetical protein
MNAHRAAAPNIVALDFRGDYVTCRKVPEVTPGSCDWCVVRNDDNGCSHSPPCDGFIFLKKEDTNAYITQRITGRRTPEGMRG